MFCPADLHECEELFECEDSGCRILTAVSNPSPIILPNPLPHRGGYSGEEQE